MLPCTVFLRCECVNVCWDCQCEWRICCKCCRRKACFECAIERVLPSHRRKWTIDHIVCIGRVDCLLVPVQYSQLVALVVGLSLDLELQENEMRIVYFPSFQYTPLKNSRKVKGRAAPLQELDEFSSVTRPEGAPARCKCWSCNSCNWFWSCNCNWSCNCKWCSSSRMGWFVASLPFILFASESIRTISQFSSPSWRSSQIGSRMLDRLA